MCDCKQLQHNHCLPALQLVMCFDLRALRPREKKGLKEIFRFVLV